MGEARFRIHSTSTGINLKQQHELQYESQHEFNIAAIGQKIGTKLALSRYQVKEILDFCRNPQSIQSIMKLAQWKDRTKFRNKYINPLLELGVIEQTIPDKLTSSKQEYFLTAKGLAFLKILGSQN